MPPRRARRPSEDEDDAEEPPRRRTASPRRPGSRGPRHPPLRRWEPDAEDDDEPDAEEERPARRRGRASDPPKKPKERVYFRARDSWYFEPLVAAAVLVVLLVGLTAYTQNFPPMYIVESDSMQHGYVDQIGLINTGDLVLAEKVAGFSVTTYEVGAQTGYSTYGEYGDVILYHPNGVTVGAPIIHRAILYIQVNSDHTFSFPSLAGQLCGSVPDAVYAISSTVNGCGTDHVSGTLTLFHVGWRSVTVRVDLASTGLASGFLTMGDNNFNSLNTSIGNPDQPTLSSLVQPGWIVGVARGMLPWFGALKLLFQGNAGEVPSQSWEWMGLTVVGLILMAIGVHWFLRAEGVEDERRKEDETAARRSEEQDDDSSAWRHPLKGWGGSDDEAEEDERPSRRRSRPPRRSWFGGGRPKPEVGRGPKRTRRRAPPDDEDDL